MEKQQILEYAMAYFDISKKFLYKVDRDKNKNILKYAMAYLKNRIEYHEDFLNKVDGDKKSFAQFYLVDRYKKELEELKNL